MGFAVYWPWSGRLEAESPIEGHLPFGGAGIDWKEVSYVLWCNRPPFRGLNRAFTPQNYRALNEIES